MSGRAGIMTVLLPRAFPSHQPTPAIVTLGLLHLLMVQSCEATVHVGCAPTQRSRRAAGRRPRRIPGASPRCRPGAEHPEKPIEGVSGRILPEARAINRREPEPVPGAA
eukprot:scaffold15075_cov94-Isochrysis_galbana.AAC.2